MTRNLNRTNKQRRNWVFKRYKVNQYFFPFNYFVAEFQSCLQAFFICLFFCCFFFKKQWKYSPIFSSVPVMDHNSILPFSHRDDFQISVCVLVSDFCPFSVSVWEEEQTELFMSLLVLILLHCIPLENHYRFFLDAESTTSHFSLF